jgi:hypothetical protein
MFKLSPASLQTFIDTPNCVLEDRVQYSTVHTPNVFCDDHRFACFLYCNHQVHRDFLIILYIIVCNYSPVVGVCTVILYECFRWIPLFKGNDSELLGGRQKDYAVRNDGTVHSSSHAIYDGGELEIKESEILPRGDWNCFVGSLYMSK